jgi:hypothetical protein
MAPLLDLQPTDLESGPFHSRINFKAYGCQLCSFPSCKGLQKASAASLNELVLVFPKWADSHGTAGLYSCE